MNSGSAIFDVAYSALCTAHAYRRERRFCKLVSMGRHGEQPKKEKSRELCHPWMM